jgi:hypothetical protein
MSIPLSVEDIERFMRAKNALPKCSACGQLAGYETYNEVANNKRYSLPRHRFPGFDLPMEVSEVIIMECRNCATIRVHNRSTIEDWVHANPAPSRPSS